MADYYQTGFDFDPGTLGYNLERFDDRVGDYMQRARKEAAKQGQAMLPVQAPWTPDGMANRWGRVATGAARAGLWMESYGEGRHSIGLRAGHSVPYGIYLEDHMEQRFRVVIPVLHEVGKALMRAMVLMFAEMDTSAPAPVIVGDPSETRPQSSVGTPAGRVRTYARDARGRFISVGKTVVTKATAVTKRTTRRRRKNV